MMSAYTRKNKQKKTYKEMKNNVAAGPEDTVDYVF